MNINELERLTGITKQNIRFYEKKGLLHPARNSENNYREYTQEDLTRLKAIKLLRKLDLPIEDIRRLLQDEAPLDQTLAQHLKLLQEKQQELSACINVCKDLLYKTKSGITQSSMPHNRTPISKHHSPVQISTPHDAVQEFSKHGTAQEKTVQDIRQSDSHLHSQFALLNIDETLRRMEEMERKGGKFMSIVQDYKRFARTEHLRGFSFKPDTMVMNSDEFTEALRHYAEENQVNLVIIKEGMYPIFRIDSLEYKAERIFDRFGATIHCSLTHPEELDARLEDLSPARKQLYKFLYGPWFFLLVLFLIMAISRQSFSWAFLVLAMIGPYLWWVLIRYFR